MELFCDDGLENMILLKLKKRGFEIASGTASFVAMLFSFDSFSWWIAPMVMSSFFAVVAFLYKGKEVSVVVFVLLMLAGFLRMFQF
ncbi:MAG: hypothetical protein PHV34_21880 [Verrucomicrobiae bacterium]|nr:hypothetical protein [Verrucomicrobiae bacterium]